MANAHDAELSAAARALPHLPTRMKHLRRDHRGFPVPWFVADIDGKPDFRVVRSGGIAEAHNKKLCWLCGQKRGRFGAFVIGPMCAINRVSSEPPSHLNCALFAAKACPFLVRPRMRRNEKDMPEESKEAAGVMIKRNPGCCLVWLTDSYEPFRTPDGGVLFEVGEPKTVWWFAEGRTATRSEVRASIESGLPLLFAEAEKDGDPGVKALRQAITRAMPLLPAETAA